ncbi:MAG: hypothetical protein AB8G23_23110 [Myxococcota bacterium]
MTETNPLAERERALENLFFEAENQKLIDRLHEKLEHESNRDQLAAALGINSEELLEGLLALGIRANNMAALIVAPLVVLAWADGQIDPSERGAIRAAEAEHLIPKDGGAAHLLEIWLEHRPHESLLEAWVTYTELLCQHLSAQARERLKTDVVGRANRLAGALQKRLVRGSGPTESEKRVLAQIETAFAPSAPNAENSKSMIDQAVQSLT